MNDLVSIIIPVYNSEKYLKDCIASLQKQKYSNIEVLFINDGSIDNSRTICEDICKLDNRFKLYNNKNYGVSYSRNYGIERASGKYLCFVDSDDIISNDFIGTLVRQITNSDSDMAICSIQGFKNNIIKKGKNSGKINESSIFSPDLESILFSKYGGYLANKLYKKSIITRNRIWLDEEVSICEDLIFNLEYLKFCSKIAVIDNVMYYYRIHASSSYYNLSNRNWFSVLDAYGKILEYDFNDDTKKSVYYNLYMIIYEAKYRCLNKFRNDDIICKKIDFYQRKIKGKFKELSLKQKIKILIFRFFPNLTMYYKTKKVGE